MFRSAWALGPRFSGPRLARIPGMARHGAVFLLSFSVAAASPGLGGYEAAARALGPAASRSAVAGRAARSPVRSWPAGTSVAALPGLVPSGPARGRGMPPGGTEPAGALAASRFEASPGGARVPDGPGSAQDSPAAPANVIVMLADSSRSLPRDAHVGWLSAGHFRNLARAYQALRESMLVDLQAAGLDADVLGAHDATPVATYRRINAATLELPSNRVASLKAALESRGHKVHANGCRSIIRPVLPLPGLEEPAADGRGAVTMPETLKLSNAGKVHAAARERWGPPDMGATLAARAARGLMRAFGSDIPQPPVAVIDSGVDRTHRQLLRVKDVKNVTRGENVDDIGHGSWVTSMLLWFAPWLRSLTHYKAFVNGDGTLDDILKAMTMAANDGNIILSNSWGSGEGGPESPENRLALKLAEEGRVGFYAVGNSGRAKMTAGFPASMAYRDSKTGAPRVIAVAATDRNKKVVYFSSRGRVHKSMAEDPRYKDWQRPDLGEQGYNTEGAWPAGLGDADRDDPELGHVKAISGTSMSTPKAAGTLALLAMFFGVTEVGERLDLLVNAVISTLVKTGEGPDDIGGGFVDVGAAYEKALQMGLVPVAPGFLARAAFRSIAWMTSRDTVLF